MSNFLAGVMTLGVIALFAGFLCLLYIFPVIAFFLFWAITGISLSLMIGIVIAATFFTCKDVVDNLFQKDEE